MNKFENFTKAMEKITEAQNLLQRGPCSYYVNEITGAYEYLMERFCPFKVGDRVMLKHSPYPMPYGWVGSAHFLVSGSIATIHSTECGPTGFVFGVEFDDESWIKRDWTTKIEEFVPVEPSRKHRFSLNENILAKI